MTKKKNGLFSKIKDKLSSKNEDEAYEDEYETEVDDSEEEDDDEYEYVDEDEDDEDDIEDDDDSKDEDEDEDYEDDVEYEDDEEDEEEYEVSDGTIELEIPEEVKPNFFQKIKNKISKKKDIDEEDDELEELVEQAVSKNAVQSMIDRFKKIKPKSEFSESKPMGLDKGISDLSPEQWIPHLLGQQNRETIHRAFLIGLTTTTFFFGGKFAGLYLGKTKDGKTPPIRPERVAMYNPRVDVAAIKNNNIFNAKESLTEKVSPKKPKEPEVKICKAAKRKSSLPIKLVNTIVLQDSVKSVASVSKRGKLMSYREGEKIDGMAEIGRIDRQKVVFKNLRSGSCEYIENVDKKAKRAFRKKKLTVQPPRKLETKGIQGVGNKYTIKKGLRDQLLSNIGEVLTQARAIQIKNPDGSLSYKMADVVPGSIYSQLDIQNGDIVTGINGKKITSLNELMSMFGKLKQTDSYEITIKRNGTEKNLNYNFTE